MDRLTADLITALRAAGLEVVVITDWLIRGRPGPFTPVGVLNHHTGASARGWTRVKELAYAKWMFLVGRPDLSAPLCQIALGRSGVVYVGAAGRANHAGTARASGTVSSGDGNTLYVGVEWMLSGTEPIPVEMMEAGVILNAVLTKTQTRTSVQTISCHYNTSVTGKWDIGDPDGVEYNGAKVLDIARFRSRVSVARQRLYGQPKRADEITNILSHGPLARLGGEDGEELSRQWEAGVRAEGREEVRNGVSVTFTLDTNIKGRFPNLGAGARRIGGEGIDLIAFRKAVRGASIKVIKRRTVKQYIDGHDAYGVRLKVTFPSGKTVRYWLVESNLGRRYTDEETFRRHCKRLRKAFGRRAVYNFMEIDEADPATERKIVREVFSDTEFAYVGGNRRVMTLVGRSAPVEIVRRDVKMLTPGMKQVSPARYMVATTLSPK